MVSRDALQPTDATYQDVDAAVQMSAPDYGRLSLEDLGEILRLSSKGKSQREIAALVGCSQPSVSYALKRMTDGPDSIRALAKAKATKALEQWDTAIEAAAKRGDHRPAREFIELAHSELRPQPAAQNYGGVTVVVAMPGGLENPRPVINVSAVCQAPGLSPAVSDDLHRLTADNKAVDVA
jgi:DNA-binding CsgD family transcriptional regulator